MFLLGEKIRHMFGRVARRMFDRDDGLPNVNWSPSLSFSGSNP